jgi:hypothetical protein
MILVALVLGWVMVLRRGDAAFALVLVWAIAGIAVRNADLPGLTFGAWVASGLALVGAGVAIWRTTGSRARPVGTGQSE